MLQKVSDQRAELSQWASIQILHGTVSNLLAGFLMTATLAFLAAFLADAKIVAWILSVGWIVTVAFVLRSYSSEKSAALERRSSLLRALIECDLVAPVQIPRIAQKDREHKRASFQTLVNALLSNMLQQIHPTGSMSKKGATMLLLVTEMSDTGVPVKSFDLFTQVGHSNFNNLAGRIRRDFRGDANFPSGMGGQAMRNEKVAVIRDCLNLKREDQWADSEGPVAFRGRAAAPITSKMLRDVDTRIGVICFDYQDPYRLSLHEERLIEWYAHKIALLWMQWGFNDSQTKNA